MYGLEGRDMRKPHIAQYFFLQLCTSIKIHSKSRSFDASSVQISRLVRDDYQAKRDGEESGLRDGFDGYIYGYPGSKSVRRWEEMESLPGGELP